MSKEKKWYSFFVSIDDEEAKKEAEKKQEEFFKAKPPSPDTASRVSSSSVTSDELPSFEQIYNTVGIKTPSHGFNIYKIEEMLRSPFLKDMNNEAKKNSILVTLEAIKVSIDEITRDAIKRNRALDSYERFEEQKLQDFENRKSEDNKKIQEEIERYFNDKRELIQRNDKLVQQAKEKFKNWLALKKAEEQKIYETLKYFAPEYSMDSILTSENNKEEEENKPTQQQ
jgi:hypothetical protein